jgi:hypothetical protein
MCVCVELSQVRTREKMARSKKATVGAPAALPVGCGAGQREGERERESRLSLTSTTPVQLGPQDADAGTQRPRHSVGVESGHDDDAESGGDVGVEAAAFVRAQGRDAGVGEEDACTRVLDEQEDAEDGRRGEAPSPLSSGSQDAQADSNVRTRPRRASLSSCR